MIHKIVEEKKPALVEACRRHGVRRLELFGSAAKGGFDPARSDLDFLVELDGRAKDLFDAYFGLLFDLEALFGRHVDLVMNDAIRNPFFREDVDKSRSLVYAA